MFGRLGPCFVAIKYATPLTVAGGITTLVGDADTSIPVSGDISSLPDKGIAQIESELILYRSKGTASLDDCVRGFYGTTAAAHDGATAALDLNVNYLIPGDTFGGTTINISETTVEIKTDQAGDTPVDEVITGTRVTIDTQLADITLDNFATILKSAIEGAAGSRGVLIKTNNGLSLRDSGNEAMVIPVYGGNPTTDPEKTITLLKAGVRADTSVSFDSSTQRSLKMTLTGYAVGSKIGYVGKAQ